MSFSVFDLFWVLLIVLTLIPVVQGMMMERIRQLAGFVLLHSVAGQNPAHDVNGRDEPAAAVFTGTCG